jgi:predicted transcriptional regulator
LGKEEESLMAEDGKQKTRIQPKHLLLLLALRRVGPVGRYRLKEILDLAEHEGVVRRMLEDLESKDFISTSKRGSILTQAGESYLKNTLEKCSIVKIAKLDMQRLGLRNSYCIHIGDKADKIDSVLKHRDDAVRAGALGALILLFKKGKIEVPRVYSDLSTKDRSVADSIIEGFDLLDNDVLIIGFAADEWRALEGALGTATRISTSL